MLVLQGLHPLPCHPHNLTQPVSRIPPRPCNQCPGLLFCATTHRSRDCGHTMGSSVPFTRPHDTVEGTAPSIVQGSGKTCLLEAGQTPGNPTALISLSHGCLICWRVFFGTPQRHENAFLVAFTVHQNSFMSGYNSLELGQTFGVAVWAKSMCPW